MRTHHLLLFAVITLTITACRSTPRQNTISSDVALGDTTITWPRESGFVVFQADVVGGAVDFIDRNHVPRCTVYGDNRVIWTDTTQPGQLIVLIDQVEDIQIRDFVNELVINKAIYTYGSQADLQPIGETPVVEEITLHVNRSEHVTDGFANWPAAYFREVLALCGGISQNPALFQASAGWVSAERVQFDQNATRIQWDAAASGVNLSALFESGERQWVDGRIAQLLWEYRVRTPSSRLFVQDDVYYRVALEVPNVTAGAPPPPTPDELTEAQTVVPPVED